MPQTRILTLAGMASFLLLIFSIGCTKNPVTPPVHDTVTVVKHDTTTNIDTLYASKPDSTINLAKGLLLYLPFSGNIADSSGNGNPTTAYGNVLTYDAHGYANNAFGASDHGEVVIVTNNGSIKFDTAMSLAFSFTSYDTARNQSFISLVNYSTGQAPSFTVGSINLGTRSWGWGIEDQSVGCSNYGGNDAYNISDTLNWVPVPGAWYNAVGVYHNGSTEFYINGKLIGSKHGLGTKINDCPSSQVVIGGWWNDPSYNGNPNGKMDNIRLYNRVLTPHEIAYLAANYQVNSMSVKPGLKTH